MGESSRFVEQLTNALMADWRMSQSEASLILYRSIQKMPPLTEAAVLTQNHKIFQALADKDVSMLCNLFTCYTKVSSM